jgi:hypothetical protein
MKATERIDEARIVMVAGLAELRRLGSGKRGEKLK